MISGIRSVLGLMPLLPRVVPGYWLCDEEDSCTLRWPMAW